MQSSSLMVTADIIAFNPAAETIFGFDDRQSVLGKNMGDLIVPRSNIAEPRIRRACADTSRRVSGLVLNKRLELTALNASGKEFDVELARSRLRRERRQPESSSDICATLPSRS